MRKGDETIVVKPKLGDASSKVVLMTAVRKPLTLYPLWYVQLYFDQVYGMYYAVAAEIWADTGEIRTTYPLGFMGAPSQSSNATSPETEIPTWPPNQPQTETPQEESQNNQPEENPPNQSTDTQPDQNTNTNITPIIAAAITTATIIAAVTTTAIYKRKQKPT